MPARMPGERARDGGIDQELVERIASLYRVIRKYSRLEVSGLDNVPDGKALLVANHTGWAGFDFANLFMVVHDDLDRDVYTAAHPNWFRLEMLRDLCQRGGVFPAGVTESVRILDKDELVLFFPEGEQGNFKPFTERYQLATFQPGFARVALAAATPVVPVVIIGGEEAHPTLTRLSFTKDLIGVGLPIPATLFPLPVKWRIHFLPPIDPEKYMTAETADGDPIESLRRDVETLMQDELDREIEARGNPFL